MVGVREVKVHEVEYFSDLPRSVWPTSTTNKSRGEREGQWNSGIVARFSRSLAGLEGSLGNFLWKAAVICPLLVQDDTLVGSCASLPRALEKIPPRRLQTTDFFSTTALVLQGPRVSSFSRLLPFFSFYFPSVPIFFFLVKDFAEIFVIHVKMSSPDTVRFHRAIVNYFPWMFQASSQASVKLFLSFMEANRWMPRAPAQPLWRGQCLLPSSKKGDGEGGWMLFICSKGWANRTSDSTSKLTLNCLPCSQTICSLLYGRGGTEDIWAA